jgi:uncharacterized protein
MKGAVKRTIVVLVLAGAAALIPGSCESLGGGSGTVLDRVFIGNASSESSHSMKVDRSDNGVNIENWRHASDGGYFQYTMKTGGNTNLAVRVRYWAHEAGERSFYIIVENQTIATENVVGKFRNEKTPQEFYNIDYPIPAALVQGKESIVVKFQGIDEYQIAGGVYGLSLVNPGVN